VGSQTRSTYRGRPRTPAHRRWQMTIPMVDPVHQCDLSLRPDVSGHGTVLSGKLLRANMVLSGEPGARTKTMDAISISRPEPDQPRASAGLRPSRTESMRAAARSAPTGRCLSGIARGGFGRIASRRAIGGINSRSSPGTVSAHRLERMREFWNTGPPAAPCPGCRKATITQNHNLVVV